MKRRRESTAHRAQPSRARSRQKKKWTKRDTRELGASAREFMEHVLRDGAPAKKHLIEAVPQTITQYSGAPLPVEWPEDDTVLRDARKTLAKADDSGEGWSASAVEVVAITRAAKRKSKQGRPGRANRNEIIDAMIRAYRKTKTYTQIAGKFGVTKRYLYSLAETKRYKDGIRK